MTKKEAILVEKRIYLDHAATSPIHPEVVQAMLGAISGSYGNPSSIHFAGREARKVLDECRAEIAASIHADEKEIIFTSGGTESDNTAVIGAAYANQEKGRHIITSTIEHHAVLRACEFLETKGFEVTYLPINSEGVIELQELKTALREDTILVSIMYGNNEIGTIQPISEIGELLSEHQAVFHTDAVQAYGLAEIDVKAMGIDLLSTSSHKINGPRGIGFLYCKNGVRLEYPFHGGEQERKRRAGTENLAGIAGMNAAQKIIHKERAAKTEDYLFFKQRMAEFWRENGIDFSVNGASASTLPHVFSVRFPDVSIEQLLMNLDMEGIAVSSGSACTAGTVDPSHVLVALYGEEHPGIQETVRFSFGLGNSLEEVEYAAEKVVGIVKRLKKKVSEK
ncbi:aminotransferase, class V [Listeria grayi DSM 20601]|uniref:cysteine desulfurase n=2 Tax=Listeria grayi TaxID=1641 RepID=D7UZ29_LISGR|nr:aminotransferase, class V [Listeria grayi DSM 20601]